MTAIGNGISLHKGLRTFTSTFFVFSDYMKPMIRLAALMKLQHVFILTHDSIGVGEDGPTHQPIEQLASLRTIPDLVTFRPADGKEVVGAWKYALTKAEGPVALVLTRQKVGVYEHTVDEVLKGAYILKEAKNAQPDLILMASGSEVELIMEAATQLEEKGINARVLSVPSMEVFEQQDVAYKESILPSSIGKRIAVEAGRSISWYPYVGGKGQIIGIDTFGISAPAAQVFSHFGLTVEAIVEKAEQY